MRDGDQSKWLGKGVDIAVDNVRQSISEVLVGMPVDQQRLIDEAMIELDGTQNKSNLGANAMLGSEHRLPVFMLVLPHTNFHCGNTSEALQVVKCLSRCLTFSMVVRMQHPMLTFRNSWLCLMVLIRSKKV